MNSIYWYSWFLGRKYVHYFVLFLYPYLHCSNHRKFVWGNGRIQVASIRSDLCILFRILVEYIARILSAPALYPGRKAVKARLKYTFSFYGFVDFVAVLPCILTYIYWDTEVVHVIILPYIFIIFKLIRHSRSFRIIGRALSAVKEELETAYTASFITICFSAILMYYIERGAQPEVFKNIGDGIWWAIITFCHRRLRRHLSGYAFREVAGMYHLPGRRGDGSHSYRYHQFFFYQHYTKKRKGNFKITT